MASLVPVILIGLLLGGSVGYAASLAITPSRLTVFTSVSSVPISTCTLTAAPADTYADGLLLNQGSNFGTATQLHVRADTLGAKRSFVRFDLGSCPVPSGSRVETATLSLYLATAPGASRTHQARRVTATWDEMTLTWSNQPAVAGAATSNVSTGTTSGVVLTWDVEVDVQAFANGTSNFGWRVADATEGALPAQEGRYSSAENATVNQRPSLSITYYP